MTLTKLILISFLSTQWFCAQAAEDPSDAKLKRAIALLQRTASGARELKEAESLGIPIAVGSVSKTDITATRTAHDSNEAFQFITKVTIAEDKEPVFQALDLAHELTHANHPKSNPFDPSLSAETYIKHGIEGEGGEADAIAQECAVGKELAESASQSGLKADTLQMIKARCQFVWNTVENEAAWKKSFYFLGQYYTEFMKSVATLNESQSAKKTWLHQMQAKSPVFSSAVAHKPYPLALLEEYMAITHKVCERAKTRAEGGRSIASVSLLKDRCLVVGTELPE